MDFYQTIDDIRKHVSTNTSLYNKHEDFKKRYPKLFAMLCDPECDQTMLQKMINLHKKFTDGKVTKEDADVRFGTVAADKYVKPLVNSETQTVENYKQPLGKTDSFTHI